ncbi:MAG: acyl-ACP thioesterase domain-containing protein [Ilumatobacteraceae bacterium]
MFEMVRRPADGRTFSGQRRVRLGDCSPSGRLRLDAAARYLQDLSDDDTRDAGLAQMTWVVRRTVIEVRQFPTYLESLDMVTWCSGIGSRWAERRVDIASSMPGSGSISSATLWVHLDGDSLRPTAPPAMFDETFSPSTGGRTVSSRLSLDPPPPDLELTPWTTRFTDFDVMNHINNAIAFALVEEVLARRRGLRAPLRVEVEYRSSIDRGIGLMFGGIDAGPPNDPAQHDGWLVDDQARCQVAFRISRPPSSRPT